MNRRSILLGAGTLAGTAAAAQLALAPAAAAAGTASVIDVRADPYGAKGDGSDATAAFTAALDAARAVPGGATLLIPPGVYKVSTSLVLSAGMTVSAYGATVVRGGNTGALVKNVGPGNPAAGTYLGAGRVAVLGGTWDMAGATHTDQCDAMVFAHAQDVLVRDCAILNVPSAHAIELNAVKHARVVDCVFDGLCGTDRNKEAVQITGATGSNNLPAPPFDFTPCVDVLITGCTLRDSTGGQAYGVLCGDHGTFEGMQHTGVRVIGNHIEGATEAGVRVAGWRHSAVVGNTVTGSAKIGIQVIEHAANTLEGLVIEGNQILGSTDPNSGGGIVVVGPAPGRTKGLVISGNTVKDTLGTAAVFLQYADGAAVTGNTVWGATLGGNVDRQGIHVYRSAGVVVSGNTVNCADGDGIGVDDGSLGVVVSGNRITDPTMNGIAVNCSDAAIRDNVVVGANTGNTADRYGIRIGGRSANVSCQGNVVRKAPTGAAAPAAVAAGAIGVVAAVTDAWVTGNDLRGWGGGAAALYDAGTGTVTTGGNAV
ncbi:right-handed parallel beta-helix repeat-containing protein [Kitasatospora sp. NPDC048365]|uniref:right-handed parallel beta-helix repeat-containing protein n=1 Tax=Kitasatospora sp. NPDC048365 TaxID=3364050 RepID=UPI003717577D